MGHTDHTKVPYRSCLACCVHTLSGIVDVHHRSTLTTATAWIKSDKHCHESVSNTGSNSLLQPSLTIPRRGVMHDSHLMPIS